MNFHPLILVVHIISSVIWLGVFPTQLILKKGINSAKGTPGERRLVSLYLFLINIAGMIGMTGILITGILLISILPYYSFFNFASSHWLAAKQVIMVLLAILVFALIIPTGKKVKKLLGEDLDKQGPLGEEFYTGLNKLSNISLAMNILVLINFLLAITHRFIY